MYSEAMVYSTYARPTFNDFDWCFGQFGLVYEPQGDVTRLTNALSYSGGWKCMIIYNPTNVSGTYIRELDNVSITVDQALIDLTIDWYMMYNDAYSEPENEESMEDTHFQGYNLNGCLTVTNDSLGTKLVLEPFWKENGYEYALGTMYLSDGTSAYVALTR